MGGAIGLVLVGALAGLVVRVDNTLANSLAAPIWLVLYPISALMGYDLATRGAGTDDGALLRIGGYSVAVAAAHAFMAVLVNVELDGRSSVWYLAYASCFAAAVPARGVAHRLARRSHLPPGALIGASIVMLLLAWMTFVVTVTASVDVDS